MKIYKPSEVTGTTEYTGVVKFIVEDSPDYNVGQFILNQGDALGPESHDNDETFFVISGTLDVEDVDNKNHHTVNTGELIVLKKGEVHRVTSADGNEVFALWFCGK